MRPDSSLVDDVAASPNFGDRRGRRIDSIVLHYTGMPTGAEALARLHDATAAVSCHYLVWDDGRITQLVAEDQRAWHAGRSFWAGETDMNAVSIGIEIVNAGHVGGCPAYPDAQIARVVALVRDISDRNGIVPSRVLGHSDIAPDRKMDPGEWFPWRTLADAGCARAVSPVPITDGPVLEPGSSGSDIEHLQGDLAGLGYGIAASGVYDAATTAVVAAFQRRFRPARVDGVADASTLLTLQAARDVRSP